MSGSEDAENGTPSTQKGLRARQTLTVTLLFTGYAAYYFCRSDLSVSMPLLIENLHHQGMNRDLALVRLGSISSLGVLAYAAGKFLLAGLGDLWGGRKSFLAGLAGAIAFTLLFASAGAVPLFTLAWIGNRLTQSIGWAGAVKVCSRWFHYSSYGTILGILSISFLVGDAAARTSMGAMIEHGYGWRALFCFAAAAAAIVFMANLFFLRESRAEAGYTEAEANPLNLFSARDSQPRGMRELLVPLLSSRAFLMVCLLSMGCTLVRETFNTWTPVYLHDYIGYAAGSAARLSAIFPAVGTLSVLITGWLSDRMGVTGRSLITLLGLTATALALIILRPIPQGETERLLPLILIGAVAFCLLGPYSYLAGAFALDFGGKQAGAAASGIIDGVGYLGGVFAGDTVARLTVAFGWPGVFTALAAVSAVSAVAGGYLFLHQRAQAAGSHGS